MGECKYYFEAETDSMLLEYKFVTLEEAEAQLQRMIVSEKEDTESMEDWCFSEVYKIEEDKRI